MGSIFHALLLQGSDGEVNLWLTDDTRVIAPVTVERPASDKTTRPPPRVNLNGRSAAPSQLGC
jgi:hypothetical protein